MNQQASYLTGISRLVYYIRVYSLWYILFKLCYSKSSKASVNVMLTYNPITYIKEHTNLLSTAVDSVDGRGLTPLHWAAAEGQTKAVQGLIQSGAYKSVVSYEIGAISSIW